MKGETGPRTERVVILSEAKNLYRQQILRLSPQDDRKSARRSFSVLSPQSSLLAVVLAAFAVAPLRALPEFRALLDEKAGYRTSCFACHQPGDNRLNAYGREYRRLKGGFAALNALDLMDPDDDRVNSKTELAARANPGDGRSKPDYVGDWLADVSPAAPPKKLLAGLFGHEIICSVEEVKLTPAQREQIERRLEEPLKDSETYQTVFTIRKSLPGYGSQDLVWHAAYTFIGEREWSSFLVVLGPHATLRAVLAVRVHGDQRLAKDEYLEQFVGKTYANLQAVAPPRDAEPRHAELLAAVRRAMRILELAETRG